MTATGDNGPPAMSAGGGSVQAVGVTALVTASPYDVIT